MQRTELFWLLSLCGFAAMSLVCGLLAWPQLSAAWPSIEERIDRFRRQPPLAKVAVLVFIVGFIAYGGTKTNQVAQTSGTNEVEIVGGGGQTNLLTCACPPPPLYSTSTVTPADIARGWQLWEVRTNHDVCYTMPEGATMATNWWVRGAYEDVVRVPSFEFRVPSFCFPYGSNEWNSAWAFTWGRLRFALGDAETEIVAVGAPMSAVPYRSRLWSAADTNGSRLVTWENFVLGREEVGKRNPFRLSEDDPPYSEAEGIPLPHSVNAQIELRPTGDFITRSNEVETAYRRIDQEDWDGDGWRNDADPDPYVWEEYCDNFWQELPEGAEESAYYWVDIRPRWNSNIWFYGDGPSDLDDPYIYAKAGETYRVRLLIGKTYDVESDQPFDIVAKSDARIEVSNVESDSCTIVWPVVLTVAEGRAPGSRPLLGATWNDGGSTFHVLPDPPWLNGRIAWETYCCGLRGDGMNFTYACDSGCTCEGCTAYGNYVYAGYALPFWGWPCGCHSVPDEGPATVSISFDRSAIIYEDAYTNAPGEVVHPVRSNAVLRCEVAGGTYGGTLSVTLNGAAQQKLRKVWGDELPNNLAIAPGAVRFFVTEYEILEPSDTANDIIATAEFLEDFRNVTHSDNAQMTAVKVYIYSANEAVENRNRSRRTYGIAEVVNCCCTPTLSGANWTAVDAGLFYAANLYSCPYYETNCRLRLTVGNVCNDFEISVIEPQDVMCQNAAMIDYSTPKGTAGYFGLALSGITLLPRTVCFGNIFVEEIPTDEGTRTGYFTNPFFSDCWSHSYAQGAGIWIGVDGNNELDTVDQATCGAVPPPWSSGGMVWPIPMGFHVEQAALGTPPIGEINANVSSVYTLMSSGKAILSKLGHWVSRNTNDVIVVDGIVVKGED